MTNPDNPSRTGEGDSPAGALELDRTKKTPSTDMQADDAGTADSGAESGSGTAAEAAMKQTSKTEAETASRR